MMYRRLPIDKHFWAFYYYCKRQGDLVKVVRRYADGTADLSVQKKNPA